jgi:hypothetical protein
MLRAGGGVCAIAVTAKKAVELTASTKHAEARELEGKNIFLFIFTLRTIVYSEARYAEGFGSMHCVENGVAAFALPRNALPLLLRSYMWAVAGRISTYYPCLASAVGIVGGNARRQIVLKNISRLNL